MRKVTFIHSPHFDIIISMKSASPPLQSPDRQKRQTGAFTLVELLVVIVIIGILTAITIPVTGRVRESARAVKCQSNLRQIGTAMLLNASENKNQITKHNYGNNIYWSHELRPYLVNNLSGVMGRRINLFCPTFDAFEGVKNVAALGYLWNSTFSGVKINSVDPSRSVIVWEDENTQAWDGTGPTGFKVARFKFRHNDQLHLLFVDAHVQRVKKIGPNYNGLDYPEFIWKP
ncbi:hypothetical protein OPIT5_06450 [Opitutaceae bacterium TAV5]|nr:hypothetical protein OPIT5_06450 [Opitutaceae bacterium TAV5]